MPPPTNCILVSFHLFPCGTLSAIISQMDNGIFKKLNAVSSGVSDAKKIIDEARKDKSLFSRQTYLLLDECHRWSKAQSDCILAAVEDGTIVFIGTTTENPYHSMTPAIVSRSKVFEFKPLEKQDIKRGTIKVVIDLILLAKNPLSNSTPLLF